MKVGIVANEFFDLALGRMGGFGWAARQSALTLRACGERRYEPVFLAGEPAPGRPNETPDHAEASPHGVRLIQRRADEAEHARRIRSEGVELLLTIDYRPHYERVLLLLPSAPIIVWVRDPRTPEDMRRIATLRLPGAAGDLPSGVPTIDCTSLGRVVAESAARERPVLLATPAPRLAVKIPATYGVGSTECAFLPNVVTLDPGEVVKSARPSVVFLGRLDPIKRPWVFVELAKRFPGVDFIVLGKSHFEGRGSWQPAALPDNVRLAGHLEGPEKIRCLAAAWALVNASIHESLAVSFLEALACETPILASVDGCGVVETHGIFVGRHDGDGLGAVPGLAEGLSRLLDDEGLRVRLGREGRRWVAETHSAAGFMREFERLCAKAGCVERLSR